MSRTFSLRTNVNSFPEVRRSLSDLESAIASSAGNVSEIQSEGTRVGDADIEILDFGRHFLLAESPDRDIDISIITATSGNRLCLLDGANTWSANQLLSGAKEFQFQNSSNRIWGSSSTIHIDGQSNLILDVAGVQQLHFTTATQSSTEHDILMVDTGAFISHQFKGIDELTSAINAESNDYLMFWDATDGIHKKQFIKGFFTRPILSLTTGTWGSAGEVLISTSTSAVGWSTFAISDLSDSSNVLLADGTVPLVASWDNIGQRIRNTGVAEVTAVEPTTPATGVVWLDTAATGTAGMGVVSVATVTNDITLTTSHTKVRCDTTANPIVVTLPATSANVGRLYKIKNIGSSGNSVTVDGNANETIDGGLTAVLVARYESITIISDGSNWDID